MDSSSAHSAYSSHNGSIDLIVTTVILAPGACEPGSELWFLTTFPVHPLGPLDPHDPDDPDENFWEAYL